MMGSGRLNIDPLISHRFNIENAESAYQLMESGNEPYLGIVIRYPEITSKDHSSAVTESRSSVGASPAKVSGKISCGILGAGNFARMVLLPAIKGCSQLHPSAICSAKGLSAKHAAETVGISTVCTDEDQILQNDDIDAVFSITRHDQHARHVVKAIEAGKHIFVEKPLCITLDEFNEIESAREDAGESCPQIMVGFNRRFSPAAKLIREFFTDVRTPLTISFRFNAGPIPEDHWTQDAIEGGGRIIGEACHAIDLCTYFAGRPTRVFAESVAGDGITDDQVHITLRHESGGISHVAYISSGDKSFPKERMEIFGGGRVAVLDDFRKVSLCKNGKTTDTKLAKQDKGHSSEIAAFAKSLTNGTTTIPWDELSSVTIASILAVRSLREGCPFNF
jgi:predicted dehydrogenase